MCLPVLSSSFVSQCQIDVTSTTSLGILFVFNILVLRSDQSISSELAFSL